MNRLGATSFFVLALVLNATIESKNSASVIGDTSTQMVRAEVEVRASSAGQLAVNPLSNVEWNLGLTPPPVRRIRFNERYGGVC